MNFEIAPKSTEVQLNWDDSIAYCDSLNIDGKTGWRLPTKKELNEIYESDNDFVGLCWSSTEYKDSAWTQCMDSGIRANAGKGYCGCFVRAIRTIG